MPENQHLINQVYGHQKAKDLLTSFLTSGKIPHAFLFTGLDGIGKDFLAIQFAKSLNTLGSVDPTVNKIITSKIDKLEEPYIKFIFPLPRAKNETDDTGPTEKFTEDEIELLRAEIQRKTNNPYYKINLPKANNIKINSIRDIKKFLSFEFSELRYRVVLISDAHLMNEEAQNALLKNLEEPPENVIFILTSSQTARLRETIISRCWRINLEPLNNSELVYILNKYFNVDKILADKIALFSEGSVQTAIRLYDLDFIKFKESTISILRNSFGKKYHSAFDELNTILADEPAKNLEVVLKMIISWVNDLNRIRFNNDQFLFADHLETLQKFYTKFPNTDITGLIFELDNLSVLIKKNVNINLLISNLVFQLSSIVITRPA